MRPSMVFTSVSAVGVYVSADKGTDLPLCWSVRSAMCACVRVCARVHVCARRHPLGIQAQPHCWHMENTDLLQPPC